MELDHPDVNSLHLGVADTKKRRPSEENRR